MYGDAHKSWPGCLGGLCSITCFALKRGAGMSVYTHECTYIEVGAISTLMHV